MKNFWDQRYLEADYAYGEFPNEYLKEKLSSLSPGKVLFPAEGEGRNAVFAANLGWEVSAFDLSEQARIKAEKLAEEKQVWIDYRVETIETSMYHENSLDAVVLVFAHFPAEKRKACHSKIATWLKSGGTLIIEGFSKNHIQNQKENQAVGGPKDPSMLYDLEELKQDFPDFRFAEALETETILSEGKYHQGKSSVIRIFAVKN